jgi:hypothetical protein
MADLLKSRIAPVRMRGPTLLPVLLLAGALAGCGDRGPASKGQAPVPKVEVATLRAQTVPVVREYVGTVTAYRSVEVRARVEGILEKRFFTEGKPVKKELAGEDRVPHRATRTEPLQRLPVRAVERQLGTGVQFGSGARHDGSLVA